MFVWMNSSEPQYTNMEIILRINLNNIATTTKKKNTQQKAWYVMLCVSKIDIYI